MKCPNCGVINHNCKVTDSRPYRGTIKRTRVCEYCNQKWRTFEIDEERFLHHAARNKTGRRFWTDKEVELLVEFVEEGLTYEEIGKKLGRSKEAIRQKTLEIRDNGDYFDILEMQGN